MNLNLSLHKALLAGVARAPIGPDSADIALRPLLASVPEPLRLWHSVAASDLWQRAGFQPSQATPQTACVEERTCPRAAEQMLDQILRGIHPEQLLNWLALAQQHGMKLPHAALVPLLDMGMQKPALRIALSRLLGQRGQWLLAQYPAWSDAFQLAGEESAETHWQLGTLEQRCLALQAMRRADPVAALAALAAGWAQETLEGRSALLPCLATGLGPLDEDFLEQALDDKRKEVRMAAQQLLGCLPGSRLSERCKTRLTALMALERKTGLGARLGAMLGMEGLPTLTLVLPETCDKAMKRDGIGIQSHYGMGEKAGWILDLMRCVAPAHWSVTWQLAPQQVLAVLAQQEFKTALITGLVQASARTLSVQPSAAAIDWFVMLAGDGAQVKTELNIPGMLMHDLERLPQPEQEGIVLHWLEDGSSGTHGFDLALAWAGQRSGAEGAAFPSALSDQLSRRLLAIIQRQMVAAPQPGYHTRGQFAVLAQALAATSLDYAHANWPASDWEHWPQWRALVDGLIDTLQFRHTMQSSFLETDA
ncbi:hypothetical protein HSX11_03885 [Oxalobacteraceae bacterium]|nr:hypothetical protein [Oxalobacteraceae bacterium]